MAVTTGSVQLVTTESVEAVTTESTLTLAAGSAPWTATASTQALSAESIPVALAESDFAPITAELLPAGTGEPRSAAGLSAPLREFLVWVARCPRTYADAMDAWRSSCPRYTVWEDALAAGLIQIDARAGTDVADARVRLTSRGEQVISYTR